MKNIKPISIISVLCLGTIVYSNSLFCSFHFDDNLYIIDNFFIRNIHNLQNIWTFYPCRFVTFFSIALNYHFNGRNVLGYHLFNLVIHLVSAILVWWLTRLTFSTPAMKEGTILKSVFQKKFLNGAEILVWLMNKGYLKKVSDTECCPKEITEIERSSIEKRYPKISNQILIILQQAQGNKIARHADIISLFVGLVFVTHPVQVQAVTYICQRAASMTALFYLASLSFYVKSRLLRVKEPASSPGKYYYIFSLIMAIVAMFTKENAITLPLMILLYEFCFFKTKKSFNWGYATPFLLTLIIIPLTILFTKSEMSQTINKVVGGAEGISPGHYLLTQFRVMVTYIRLVFIPINLNLDYDFPIYKNILELPVLISFLFLTTILFLAKRLFSNYRLISFSIFWFFLTLLPESSFLPLQDVIFEHRLYLPLVGYSMFLVSGLYHLFGEKNIKMMAIVLMMIMTCNSVLTYQRNKVWKDDLTLWSDAARKSPHKARPYNGLGVAYFKQGDLAQALVNYNKAIKISPNYANAYNGRANVYYKQGNLTQAQSDYKKAIEINPNFAEDYYNRGILYDKQNNFAQALSAYKKAIEINPNMAEVYYNRGNTYKEQNNFTQALYNYKIAIEKDPNYDKAYINRGNIYSRQGDFTQALSDYSKAIEINPNYAEAYINRGNTYSRQDDLTQALADYNKVIEINPNYVGIYNNRAVVYYLLKEYDKAWGDVYKAEELGGGINPKFLKTLKELSGRDQ